MNQPSKPGHAIVLGGSIVGSAVAAMLADRFSRVTIVERDSLPHAPNPRGGVPQSRHVHALLARGAAELERLFPGFLDQMVLRGAQIVDIGSDVAWLTPGGWGVPFESKIRMCCATRDLIEWQARRRALARPNVSLFDQAAVTGLVTDAAAARVIGVSVRDRRRRPSDPPLELRADLVIDATGRASQLPEWLAEIGRPRVHEVVVDARMTYASRFYAVRPGALRQWRAAYVQPALPREQRGGILFPVENDRCHLTLFGYGDAAPPTDGAGFEAFLHGLRSPILADVLHDATPLTAIVGHRRTENRWRRFDEIADWPDGLVAVGDSVCCFDPVYGQGMTTGILGAGALARRMDRDWRSASAPSGFARRVQRDMVGVVRPAWNLATSEDLRIPSTQGGELRWIDRQLQRYLDGVIATATADPVVRLRLLSVMNMLAGPGSLMHWRVATRVVRYLAGLTAARPPLWPDRPQAASTGTADPPSRPMRPRVA